MRPPNAAASLEECLQVYNDDLAGLTPSELTGEILRAARIAARDPQRFVWRGMTHITARQWADERIMACRERLAPPRRSASPPRKDKTRAWVP
jgi:hypothetical protein